MEKHEIDELSDEGETSFYDATEFLSDSVNTSPLTLSNTGHAGENHKAEDNSCNPEMMCTETEWNGHHLFPLTERRDKLPEPHEKEKGVSLWSIIKDSVGKDLTRVCLPVYFNEPLSSLQKCFEELEYSYLLDQAYHYGKMVSLHLTFLIFYLCKFFEIYY